MADRPHKKRIRITSRDSQILEELLHKRVETLGALHDQFWPDGSDRDSARHRLSRLAAWGFIDKLALEHAHPQLLHPNDHTASGWVTVYTLTPKGIAALRRRSLAGSVIRARSIKGDIDEAAIPHQLAVNRIGQLLGTTLLADHLIETTGDRRHRPDATYTTTPDSRGRATVMLEIDLGHYSRKRILGKLTTFLADPDAKGALFACPTPERAAWLAHTLREARGDHIMDRVQVLSFEQIKEARLLRDDFKPDPTPTTTFDDPYAHLPHAT